MGPVNDMDRFMMAFPADQSLPKFKKADVPNGWIIISMDQMATIEPWRISYAANLTPDATVIGNWSCENLKGALVEGKYRGAGSRKNPYATYALAEHKSNEGRRYASNVRLSTIAGTYRKCGASIHTDSCHEIKSNVIID